MGRQNDQQNRSWFGWERTNCIHKALFGRILILLMMMAFAFPGAAAQAMTVGFFTDAGGLGDDAFTDSAYSGLRKAQQIHGFRLIVEEPGPSGRVSAKNAESIINQCDVLVMLGSQHSEADFSHGICPDCVQRLYPGYFKSPPDG